MARVRISPGLGRKIREASSEGIARDMMRRGLRVEAAAKKRISVSPKRVDKGRLRSSIRTVPIRAGFSRGARVGSNVKYARFVHDGTGIYGPRGTPIKPRTKKFLRFRPKGVKGKKGYVFAKSVKGMRPNPYLKDALPAARG